MNLGLKISAGMSYFYLLPDWNEYFENTYTSFSLNAVYKFKFTKFPGYLNFLKYTGANFECTYASFKGIKEFNRVESDLTDIIADMNLLIGTNFTFPLNFALRGGGGIVYTRQEFLKYDAFGDPAETGTTQSFDFFYNAGLSLEYRFYSFLFIEAFTDYYNINYLTKPFNAMRFSCQLGVRL